MKIVNKLTLSTIVSMLVYSNIYANDIKTLDKLTVTAQKKAENIQEVPISMTLLDEISIVDNNIELVEDIAAYTPNLMFFSYGSDSQISPSLRGIFSDMEAKTVPMAIYIDGVPILDGWAMNEELNNIERIEVLKGPQGTLYGKNAETGVMNIHTKQPSNITQGSISLEVGSDNKRKINLNVSGALIENKLLIGISASHYEKDGFLKDKNTGKTIDDRKRNSVRVNIIYKPTDNLEISFINSILKYDDGSVKMSYVTQGKNDISQNFKGYNKSQIVNNALKIKYTISDRSYIESITTRRSFNLKDGDDWDFTNNPVPQYHMIRDTNTKSYSEEIKYIDSFLNNKLDFLAGIYMDEKDENFDFAWSGYPIERDFNDKSLGLFTHIKYQISNNLSILTGIRYDKENKEFTDKNRNIKEDSTYSEISPKVSLEYNFENNKMAYFTIAKGYRAGGFNHNAPIGHANLIFEKETLWNYEAGYKSVMLDDKLTFNTSIYYMDIKNMQVTSAISPAEEYVSNAGEAHSQGLELEVNYQINDELNIFSSLGVNETKFDKFKDFNGNYKGKTNPFAPKYNYYIGAKYRANAGYYASANLNGYGKMYFDKENKYEKKAYTLVNTKVGYETKKFDIYMYAKNLFDKNHDSVGYHDSYTIYSEEREIGIQVTYRF
ncbi:TonB-dependent receptor [Sulfurimonas sp.]|uniref:TonB-dependent receptor n=1 Tax=Sulfurimonas sp. TaxID=2022749 RepID=UPI002B4A065D|nr:TonB-dependent receptor [Sulfurimonas sp.]